VVRKKHKIGVVINYCTNDYIFIRHCVNEVKGFASEIVVPVADHFFDGSPEDQELLQKTVKENPEVKFILFKWHSKPPPFPGHWFWQLIPRRTGLRPLYGSQYWVCNSRFIGYQSFSCNPDYILFLDVDEIPEGSRFKEWLATGEYLDFDVLKFSCYLYLRKPIYQRIDYGENPVLAKTRLLNKRVFSDYSDRENIFRQINGRKKRMVTGTDGLPLFHHYSWARPLDNLYKKVKTWGHNLDCDWDKFIEENFLPRDDEVEFIKAKGYKVVKPYIDF